ncbi:glutamyl-Q tRNA(Asp) synthetase [Lysobacter helvus]|uniref:Glutamyl-Q tRNA(Asp) synthetase n=2 Tax=Lysobacteraceae TaxID=32033 RepID=A0ABM7Q1N2_9GAMM|nr:MULTISPECIES: tRNA glutamyl-Q(34) synthetase GluQRS [Lysobacter]BCT91121.1 glutamyl-Q tRNA(Asp) synthetase [Lysobacter caseinilyticus]BCT94274.1 glutamyl-Q tRNA(Asp) synthetase [Lysobacter helvus]
MFTDTHVRGRFAPSPTGPLHPGSLLAALGSWLFAHHARGAWLVRVEDIDPPREQAGAIDHQLRTLAAFGFTPDEAVLYQSTRDAAYAEALGQLIDAGTAFECWCSRTDLAPAGGIHHACVAGPQPGRTPAVRLRVPAGTHVAFDDAIQGRVVQDVSAEVGDFVLRRADGLWAYQLAVVVDDAAQGITDIVRGADLLDSTPRQIVLQRALGLPTPRYAHLPLVVDDAGRKLSKSQAALPIDAADPLPALRFAWAALGQSPAALADCASPGAALAAALVEFDPSRIPSRSIALHNATVASDA